MHVLYEPLSKAINNSLWQDVSLNDPKIPLVSPLDKGTSKKNEISSSRTVIILTTFSRIY